MNGEDPLIREIREIRRRMSEQFGNDPVRLFDHIVEYQKQFKDRLISRRDLLGGDVEADPLPGEA